MFYVYKFLLSAFILIIVKSIEASDTNFGRIVQNRDYVCINPSVFGFVNRIGTNKYYLIGNIMLNWIDSENYCQKFGAHLPSILNKNDDDFIRSLSGDGADLNNAYLLDTVVTSRSGVWLGGYLSTKKKWTWTDGNVFSYTNWAQGQPDYAGDIEYFLHHRYVNKNYTGWNDWRVSAYMNFICQLTC